MTKILVPRSDSVSAKVIEPSDFEELHSYVPDHVKSGFTVTAGSGLAVNVSSGKARLKGLFIHNSATETKGSLTANQTNYIFITLARDSNSEAESWSLTSSTSNSTPTDSFMIASCVCGSSSVSSVSQTMLDTKREPAYVPTGAILMWHGALADIPTGWVLCDGNNGTPNLIAKFVRGINTSSANPSTTGGLDSRDIVIPRNELSYVGNAHVQQSGDPYFACDPSSTETMATAGEWWVNSNSSRQTSAYDDLTSVGLGGGQTCGGGSNSYAGYKSDWVLKTNGQTISNVENRPAFYEVAYIMKT